MSAILLDGESLARKIKEGLKKEIEDFKSKGKLLTLVAIQVGENPASRVYVNQQKKACEEMGLVYSLKELPATTTELELINVVESLNKDVFVTGIILQMPLPQNMNPKNVQVKISPEKDVEGLNPYNIGLLVYGKQKVAPCTAMGAVELLKSSGVELKGKEVVIVGHSEIVGKPITLLMLQSLLESPTPTICHIATKDLSFHTKRADIVFVGVGKPGLIKGDMLKEGSIVIDIGINRIPVLNEKGEKIIDEKSGKPKMKTVGDVEFEKAKEICSYISPVPGGVGPLTVTMLIKNTVECAKWQG
ncbi:MAG: bifunctional 5,10-methylenetetrahydrofolate dehydrogenase/5,10-methenyltetrahydrofolate cyclohydrolase [Candidatus Firestonebacteria bacterium]